jgi:cell shape-determining protein MreC
MYLQIGFRLPPNKSSHVQHVQARATEMLEFWINVDKKLQKIDNFWTTALDYVKNSQETLSEVVDKLVEYFNGYKGYKIDSFI